MSNSTNILIVIETYEITTGAADWKGLHLCDYGACTGTNRIIPFSDLAGVENRYVPSEHMPLFYAVRDAAEELDCEHEFIDVSQLGFIQRMKERLSGKAIPRLEIGDRILAGVPTKDDIIQFYSEVAGLKLDKQDELSTTVESKTSSSSSIIEDKAVFDK